MRVAETEGIYEGLGVRRVINAMGSVTLLGGSRLSPGVLAAMAEANESFVEMEDLLERSGRAVAEILGTEAALVTSGCFAAMVLGTAAIMAGSDPDRIARLPDATGLKNEFLVQKATRYEYDRAVGVAGGRLVEVGDTRATTAEQLEAAVGGRTAGVLYAAKFDGAEGVVPLPAVVGLAKRHGIAVLVDAAAEVYPLDRMTRLAAQSGADLVCFGAKYIGSANSTGILCGRREFVEAATRHNFVAFETLQNHAMGRGYKVDRQEVAGTVVALREWFSADHEALFQAQRRRVETIERALAGLPHVRTRRTQPREGAWLMLRVEFDSGRAGPTAATVERALREGDPAIRVRLEDDQIVVAVHNLRDGEDEVVAARLEQILAGG